MTQKTHYDAVIVGGGHNGLVAAAYLARAGISVLVLERKAVTGGAAVSAQVFPGVAARLSRYSYLLSMFPYRILEELGVQLEARPRRTACVSPVKENGVHKALLLSNGDPAHAAQAFCDFTGSDNEYRGYRAFYDKVSVFADKVWDSMLQPLISRAQMQALFTSPEERAIWEMLIEAPLGRAIEAHVHDDTVRGMVYTDASISVLSHPHDESLKQNRTFLYHVIGNKAGEWRVPVGGMGRLTDELARIARQFGAEINTGAEVTTVHPGQRVEIVYRQGDHERTVSAGYALINAAPSVMAGLIPDHRPIAANEGTAFKINMVVKRLPALAAPNIDPALAFAGTFHINETYTNLQASYQSAITGQMPDPIPGEIYCHTLTDPSILAPELAAQGYHTLTLYGVNAAHRLFTANPDAARAHALQLYLEGIDHYLAEPLETCLAIDANGNPCIEAKSAVDLEHELRLPRGHIFHNDQSWIFADDPAQAGTWGVETEYPNIFLCGSGALRGGCVSGITGHNAAMKTLESMGKR
ncbi:MAG: NAD(P)/FAD-dependent oxidoreductase [bacterium]|nr:NAD(P)/FAD-dependent oxidoreductase [bacterium]